MPIQRWSDQIWLVTLGNEPALSEDLIGVRDQAKSSDNAPDIVLDLAGVTQLNSSNLSQLLRLRKLAIDRDTRLKLAAISDGIWAVFLTTGLDKLFDFAGDVTTALAALQIER